MHSLSPYPNCIACQLLLPLITAYRHEGPEVNMTLAKSESRILHEKISKKEYADDELIRILSTRSKAQLGATFNHYNNEFGHPINKVGSALHLVLISLSENILKIIFIA